VSPSPRHLLAVLSALVVGLGARAARADGLILGGGDSGRVTAVEAVIHQSEDRVVLVETVHAELTARRIAWLRAFPSDPELAPVDPLDLEALEQVTAVRPPHRQELEDDIFGPSVVSLIRHRLRRRISTGDDVETLTVPVSGDGLVRFTGPVLSSTTGVPNRLPVALESWLGERDFQLSPAEHRVLVRYLESGWTLVGRVLELPPFAGARRLRIGPTRYGFRAEGPLHPILGFAAPSDPTVRFSYLTITPTPVRPPVFETVWDEEGWAPGGEEPDRYRAILNRPLDDATAVALDPVLGFRPEGEAAVVAGTLRIGGPLFGDLSFAPAQDPRPLPPSDGRGSPFDLALILLLGVAPLIYTPESWFLLWYGARAREQRAPGVSLSFGMALWPLYALAIALYWLITLDGLGRAAALLPAVIGAFRMLRAPEPAARSHRVKFGKKKTHDVTPSRPSKAADSKASGPSKPSKAPGSRASGPSRPAKPASGASKPSRGPASRASAGPGPIKAK
jgi:hypothetical protein